METIAFCEIEDYPRQVLKKHWPEIPLAGDVTKLTYKDGALYDDGQEIYRGPIDAICGGFPCQDISLAGKQEGIKDGTRSGLWSECARLLREIRPDYAIFENVTALLSGQQGRWFQRVLFDISEVGYDAEWHCISASELGAHHHRDRVWIIAYAEVMQRYGGELDRKNVKPSSQQFGGSYSQNFVPNTQSARLQRREKFGIFGEGREGWHKLIAGLVRGIWENSTIEPTLCGKSNGVPNRSHRLKGLGNAVVPQIPEILGRVILNDTNKPQ